MTLAREQDERSEPPAPRSPVATTATPNPACRELLGRAEGLAATIGDGTVRSTDALALSTLGIGSCPFDARRTAQAPASATLATVRVRGSVLVAVILLLVRVPTSSATTCIYQTEEQARRAADVVFKGVAEGGRSLQTLPGQEIVEHVARFRVDHYSKGAGPAEVKVRTGRTSQPGGLEGFVEGGVDPKAGEHWVIYGDQQPDGFVRTSHCDGSHPASERGSFNTGTGARLADHVRFRWPWLVAVPLVLISMVGLTRRRLRALNSETP